MTKRKKPPISQQPATQDSNSPLKKLREQVGLTQEELSRLIDVSARTVSNWETGRHPATMTVRQIKALCKALNVTLDELPDDFGAVDQDEG